MFVKLFVESFVFAFDSLRANRLRSLLSLLGITIGIFTIIAVFTGVDALKTTVTSSISKLGTKKIYIEKFPWGLEPGETEYPWWKYVQRPLVTIGEYRTLKERVSLDEQVSYQIDLPSMTVKYKSGSVSGAELSAVSEEDRWVSTYNFAEGRNFTDVESRSGRAVCMLGATIGAGLFRDKETATGKFIKLDGRDVKVTGVLTKDGDDLLHLSNDNRVIIPVDYARSILDIRSNRVSPSIVIKGSDRFSFDQMQSDIEVAFRAIRKLRPGQLKNFALNNPSIITRVFDSLSKILDTAGWIIGGFSVLVGGFGIANIMFVSVKERTPLIGIQKSLGAKNYFILLQFLIESVLLCVIGGLIGLLMVWSASSAAAAQLHISLPLKLSNVLTGITLSVIIGVVSGYYPALSASRMDPVEAIRS